MLVKVENILPVKSDFKFFGSFKFASLSYGSNIFSISVIKLNFEFFSAYIFISSENIPISSIATSLLLKGCFLCLLI
jgi:hypothetical protein